MLCLCTESQSHRMNIATELCQDAPSQIQIKPAAAIIFGSDSLSDLNHSSVTVS